MAGAPSGHSSLRLIPDGDLKAVQDRYSSATPPAWAAWEPSAPKGPAWTREPHKPASVSVDARGQPL